MRSDLTVTELSVRGNWWLRGKAKDVVRYSRSLPDLTLSDYLDSRMRGSGPSTPNAQGERCPRS